MRPTPRYPAPAGGIKATLTGGNTIGAFVREREPRADGYRHIDTPALIRRLRELSANTYLYTVWDSPTDFDDLRDEFLPAAAAAGIAVIPYIVPPTETAEDGRASRPFLMDYVGWAKALAELSLKYPNLTAWAIDDFEFDRNAELFTPDYMAAMQRAAATNPDLRFYTCAYYAKATSEEFLDKYAPYVDGIIYPFLDGRNKNTTIAGSLGRCLDDILALTEPRDLELIPLIYTGRFLDAPMPPMEDYVTETLTIAAEYVRAGRIPGVIAYGTQLDDAPTPATDHRALYGAGRLALVAPHSAVPAGSVAAASQRVTVDPASRRYEVSFWYHRWFLPDGVEAGTYVLELLVDDAVVWSSDVHEQPWDLWMQGEIMHGPVDVTEAVAGRSEVTLTFRLRSLRDTAGSYVDVGVDHLQTVGLYVRDPGFERAGSWTLEGDGPLLAVVDIHVPDRPARIFDAVSRCFANG
jgi:hypothetical protein